MPRPRRDGAPPRATSKRKLTDTFAATCRDPGLVWDAYQPGLALSVRPTGKKAWKVIYRFHGRPVWLHLGDVRSIGLADARRLAARIMLDVAEEGPRGGTQGRAHRRQLRRSRQPVCRAARQAP